MCIHTQTGTRTHIHKQRFAVLMSLSLCFSSCTTRDLSKWQQLACSVQANWSHLHNTCLPSQFICGQSKQVCVTLSQPDVKSRTDFINDPQSQAIISHKAYHSHRDILYRAVCFFFNENMDCICQHRQMHILSKPCLPSVPLRMQLLRGWKQASSFVWRWAAVATKTLMLY